MKKLVLESTAPFQGLPELVAYDEGLFEKEGLQVEWADREQGVEKKVRNDITSPKSVDPFLSHGKLFERGQADMYNACEWGNYCRVQATDAGSRQIGRRAIIAYAALVVRGDSATLAAFNRAVREAVRRINANKGAYLRYFIDYHAKSDPEIAALKVEDLRESRLVVCDPAPIPLDEMQRTYDWLKSWGMLEETASPLQLVDMDVQRYAHQAAQQASGVRNRA